MSPLRLVILTNNSFYVGFAGAMLNPFTIGIAQGIAELPLFSGLEYRMVCWVLLTLFCIAFVLWPRGGFRA